MRVENFEVYVTDPYPVWVNISHGGTVLRFSHKELCDLEYAVKLAKREAKDNLGSSAHEVEF